MTFKALIKSEYRQIWRDKIYRYLFLILSLLNWSVLGYLVISFDHKVAQPSEFWGGLLVIGILLLWLAIFILLYWYPFHLVSVDYQSHRQLEGKLKNIFWAKLLAVVTSTLGFALVLVILPLLILMQKLASTGYFLSVFLPTFVKELSTHGYWLLINGFAGYLLSLMLVFFACITLKGANTAILLFIGLNWLFGVMTNFVTHLVLGASNNLTQGFVVQSSIQIGLDLIGIVVFIWLAWRQFEQQSH